VAQPALGWLYNDDIIERGYLINDDFPSWVVDSDESMDGSMNMIAILMSRCKWWYAFYKKLKGDRSGTACFIPMPPLNLFKSETQFVYNKGKGVLDKGTEQEARIRPKVKVAFEGKNILRMISAIVINAWRTEQACTLLHPFLITNPNPLVKQLRRQLRTESTRLCIHFSKESAENPGHSKK
jgi:hypothetical protein